MKNRAVVELIMVIILVVFGLLSLRKSLTSATVPAAPVSSDNALIKYK